MAVMTKIDPLEGQDCPHTFLHRTELTSLRGELNWIYQTAECAKRLEIT